MSLILSSSSVGSGQCLMSQSPIPVLSVISGADEIYLISVDEPNRSYQHDVIRWLYRWGGWDEARPDNRLSGLVSPWSDFPCKFEYVCLWGYSNREYCWFQNISSDSEISTTALAGQCKLMAIPCYPNWCTTRCEFAIYGLLFLQFMVGLSMHKLFTDELLS